MQTDFQRTLGVGWGTALSGFGASEITTTNLSRSLKDVKGSYATEYNFLTLQKRKFLNRANKMRSR